jgi:hypothetical protein
MNYRGQALGCYDSRFVAWENSPLTTMASRLAAEGRHYRPSDDLNDVQIATKLWLLVAELAEYGIYLSGTNHLSDRELYHLICSRHLREPIKLPAPGMGWYAEWDMQFAVDGGTRRSHYDRDRFLPRKEFPPFRIACSGR